MNPDGTSDDDIRWKEAYAPQMYVTFLGREPIPAKERPVTEPGEIPVTQRSVHRTFGPYFSVDITDDYVEVNPGPFPEPGDDEGYKFLLATRDDLTGNWILSDGLEEDEGSPVYEWLRVEPYNGLTARESVPKKG